MREASLHLGFTWLQKISRSRLLVELTADMLPMYSNLADINTCCCIITSSLYAKCMPSRIDPSQLKYHGPIWNCLWIWDCWNSQSVWDPANLPGCSNLDATKSASDRADLHYNQAKDRHPSHPCSVPSVLNTGMQTCWHKSLSAVLQCSSEEFLSMISCCTAWNKCKLFHIILSKSAVSRLCTWP